MKNIKIKAIRGLAVIASITAVISSVGCMGIKKPSESSAPAQPSQYSIVVTSFPLYDFTKNVVGDEARITVIEGGGNPNYEISSKDISKINAADVFIFAGEPWAINYLNDEETSEDIVAVNAAKDVNHYEDTVYNYAGVCSSITLPYNMKTLEGDYIEEDMAYWLSIDNASQMVTTIMENIANYDYEKELLYGEAAKAYQAKLANLGERYIRLAENSGSKAAVFAGSFESYYLCAYLGISPVSVYDGRISSDEPVSLNRLNDIYSFIANNNVSYVLIPPENISTAFKTVSSTAKCETLIMNDMTHIDKGDYDSNSYLDIMEANYGVLKQCLY